MSDNLAIIRTYAQTLTDDDLHAAWRILYEEHQRRGEVNAKQLKYTLREGDHVQWTGKRGTKTGEVLRVKRKKAIVAEHLSGKLDMGSRWDIPLTMLKKIAK